MMMEETRRRNEASMARKRLNNVKGIGTSLANSGAPSDGPMSPASTGAMDSLLEKLRAAAPQARDQRDRRRRARLKDRHQIRVASGQTIPDLGDLTKGSEDDEIERSVSNHDGGESGDMAEDGTSEMPAISEGEDIAERAASMLQGLRGDGESDGKTGSRDSSLRIRRRRESADDERSRRRRRRGAGSSSHDGGTEDRDSPVPASQDGPIPEESETITTPTTLVSPPSPKGTQKHPVDLSD